MAKGGRPVDEAILKMTMDSKKFEQDVNRVQSLFDKIRDKIRGVNKEDLSKVQNGFENVGRSAGKVNLDKLKAGMDTTMNKAGIFEKIFDGVFLRIGQRIADTTMYMGNMVLNALGSKSMSDGFREYETKIGAIQTIMSNTQGKHSVKEVTALLDELNKYADDTIYNFGDMTRNIGTFTAAGVGLEDSVVSIKGIANLAAASGSSAQQASTAMYQLSQALAAGRVSLQDWNSVVNAGMGGKVFQDALKQTAKEMGKNINSAKTFRESLRDGWLTAEVLTKTLTKFANDDSMKEAATKVKTWTQLWDTIGESMGSSWAKTWEMIVGDFEEAPKFLTRIKDAIEKNIESQAQWRDNIVKTFVELNGRTRMLDALFGMFDGVGKLFSALGAAWREAFPPDTKKHVEGFIGGFESLMKFLTPSEDMINKIVEAFKMFLEILKQVIPVMKIMWDVSKEFFKFLSGPVFNLIIAAITGTLGYLLDFNRILINTFNNLTKVGENQGPSKMTQAFKALFGILGSIVDGMADFVRNFKSNSGSLVDSILTFFRESYTAVANFVKDIFSKINYRDVIAVGISTFMFKKMQGITKGFKSSFSFVKQIQDLTGNFVEAMESVSESLSKAAESLAKIPKAMLANINIKSFLYMAIAIGILAGAMWILSQIPIDKLGVATVAVGILFGLLDQTLKSMMKFQKKIMSVNVVGLMAAGTGMILLSGSMVLLAMAVAKLGGVDMVQMAAATGVVGVLMVFMTFVIKSLTKTANKHKKGMAAIKGLIGFAAAIYLLTYSVKAIADMDYIAMAKGLGGVSILMIAMAASMKIMNGTKIKLTTIGAMFSMVEAVKSLVNVLFDISKYPWKSLLKATGVMGAVFTMLVGSIVIIDKAPIDAGKMYAVSSYAYGVVGLVNSLITLVPIPWKSLLKAVGTVGAVMLAITINMALLKGLKFSDQDIKPFFVYMIATLMLIKQIKPLSEIPFSSMMKAIIGMGSVMLAITANMAILSFIPKTPMATIVAMATFVSSTKGIIKMIEPLSQIPFTSMVKAIFGISAVFVVITGMMFALSQMKVSLSATLQLLALNTVLLTLSSTLNVLAAIPFDKYPSIAAGLAAMGVLLLALIGVSFIISKMKGFKLSDALGMLALAAAVLLLSKALSFIKDADMGALAISIGAIVVVLLALAAAAAVMRVGGIVGIAGLVTALLGLSTVMYAISAVIGSFVIMLQVLSSQGIVAFNTFGQGIQILVAQLQIAVLSVLTFLMTTAPQIGFALANIVLGTIQSVLMVLMVRGPMIIQMLATTVIQMLIALLQTIAVQGPMLVSQLVTTVLALIAAVRDRIPDILQAAIDFVLAFINGFADTIRNNQEEIKSALLNLLTAIGEFVLSIFSDIFNYFAENGPEIFNKILDFCSKIPGKIWEGIMNLGGWIFDKLKEIGGNFIEGLFNGIGDIGKAIWDYIKGGFDSLVGNIMGFFGIKSPSRLMMGIGGYITEGMAIGVGSNVGMVQDEMQNISNVVKDEADGIANGLQDSLNRKYNLTADVTPVLKDTDLEPINLQGNIRAKRFDNIIPKQMSAGNNITNSTANTYDIHVHATGDLPDSTIRKMATKIKQEIKNQNDSEIMAKGRRGLF